jgi:hypothetical protein
MSVAGEYRKQAEQCRLRAESSSKPADRAFWLSLAENWQKLAQDADGPTRDELQNLRSTAAE